MGRWEERGFPVAGGEEGRGVGFLVWGVFRRAKMEVFSAQGFQRGVGAGGFQRGRGAGGSIKGGSARGFQQEVGGFPVIFYRGWEWVPTGKREATMGKKKLNQTVRKESSGSSSSLVGPLV